MGREGDDLMQLIRRRAGWYLIGQTARAHWEYWDGEKAYWNSRSIYRIRVNLGDLGLFSIEVETKAFNLGSNGTLSHSLCCHISTTLAQDYLHSTHCLYPEDFCIRWCTDINQTNWAAAAEWKTSELELPETVRQQLVSTMQWMFWAAILDKF